MTHTRKKWNRPELIVLLRMRPDEAVLANCKGPGGQSPDYRNCLDEGGDPACSSTNIS